MMDMMREDRAELYDHYSSISPRIIVFGRNNIMSDNSIVGRDTVASENYARSPFFADVEIRPKKNPPLISEQSCSFAT